MTTTKLRNVMDWLLSREIWYRYCPKLHVRWRISGNVSHWTKLGDHCKIDRNCNFSFGLQVFVRHVFSTSAVQRRSHDPRSGTVRFFIFYFDNFRGTFHNVGKKIAECCQHLPSEKHSDYQRTFNTQFLEEEKETCSLPFPGLTGYYLNKDRV